MKMNNSSIGRNLICSRFKLIATVVLFSFIVTVCKLNLIEISHEQDYLPEDALTGQTMQELKTFAQGIQKDTRSTERRKPKSSFVYSSDLRNQVEISPKQIVPGEFLWGDAKCLPLYYNFTRTGKTNSGTLRGSIQQPIKHGSVVIQKDHNIQLSSGPLQLTDDTYLAPSNYICHNSLSSDRLALITMATTMFFGKDTSLLMNTIKIWSLLRPLVQPVLYVTPSSTQNEANKVITSACNLGWDVFIAPECNEHNFPVLRSMIVDSLHKYDTPLVGYANGDILFDDTLPETLKYFLEHEKTIQQPNSPNTLIIGRRNDIKLPKGKQFNSLEHVRKSAKGGHLHSELGIDYFISTRNGFQWESIPPFVIARPVFDNWLVWYGIQSENKVTVIDTSFSITALHQAEEKKPSGWKSTKIDESYNIDMLYPFPVMQGGTYCVARKLNRLKNGVLQLKEVKIKKERRGCKVLGGKVILQGK